MEEFKYCPVCKAEYYAHIEKCADCGEILKTAKELEETASMEDNDLNMDSDVVIIREGDKNWIYELCEYIDSQGVRCKVVCRPTCNPGGCGETFQLLVSSDDLKKAEQLIVKYTQEVFPELKKSLENSNCGKCPACEHHVGVDARECPDCGLILIFEE